MIEAKRVARPFFDRPADPERALACLQGNVVMSPSERARPYDLADVAPP